MAASPRANGAGGGSGSATWSNQLQVFEQDFDTAMEIWLYQDPAVERLYCDEKRTRRHKSVSSQDEPYLSQPQSQSQSQSQSQRAARKRRRRIIGAHEMRADVPLPPLLLSLPTELNQAIEPTALPSADTSTLVQISTGESTLGTAAKGSASSSTAIQSESTDIEDSCGERVPVINSEVDKAKRAPIDSVDASHLHPERDIREFSRFNMADLDRIHTLADSNGGFPTVNRTKSTRARDQVPLGMTAADLFQTGSGKAVHVSSSRLHEYEEKLRQEESSVRVRGDTPASDSTNGAMVPGTTVAGLFQTGLGKNIHVSASRLNDYAERLMCDDVSDESHTVTRRRETSLSPGSTIVSLFQTGSGKSVRVSRDRLRTYQDKLSEDTSEVHPSNSTASEPTMQSLFQTGSGRNISISKSHLRDYERKLGEEESAQTGSIHGGTDSSSDMAVVGLFQTGSGKSVRVSKKRLLDYEEKLRARDDAMNTDECFVEESSPSNGYQGSGTAYAVNAVEPDTSTAEPPSPTTEHTIVGLFQTGSGKVMRIPKARLREYEAKLEKDAHLSETVLGDSSAAQVPSTVTVESLFQTGLGEGIEISHARLQDYEQRIRGEVEAVPGSNSTALDAERSSVRGTRQIASANTPSALEPDDIIVGMFQTGSGKRVRVSKERLQDYEEKFQEEESDSEASREDSTAQDTAAMSLFQTGLGKSVRVSKEQLRVYEGRLFEEESAGVSLQDTTETQGDSTASVASLFQTGSGDTLRVSKKRLREFEAKMQEDSSAATARETADRDMQSRFPSETSNTAHDGGGPGPGSDEDSRLQRQAVGQRPSFPRRPPLLPVRVRSNPVSLSNVDTGSQWKQRPPRPPPRAILSEANLPFGKERQIGGNNPAHDREAAESMSGTLKKSSNSTPGLHKTFQKGSAMGVMPRPQSRMLGSPRVVGSNSSSTVSRRQVGDKRLFRPPVLKTPDAVTNQQVTTVPRTLHSSLMIRPAVNRLESPPRPASSAFRFREIMKVSFGLLQEMQAADHGGGDTQLVEEDCELTSITAANATLVIFPRGESTPSATHFRLRSSFEEPYDAREFMGLQEMHCHMKEVGLLELTPGAARMANGATFEWFANHYRWIVWKLTSMERTFPRFLLGKYLTKDQVVRQITDRYQRDVVSADRSVLKKMLNRDSSSLSCMVLCVASVLPFPKRGNEMQELPDHWKLALVLTDGWYAVYAVPDNPLAAALWRAHTKSSIVGTKIAVWNSALRNSTEGIDPLECAIARCDCNSPTPWTNPLLAADSEELTQWPYLELHYNSTRRVRFGEQLGAEQLRVVSSAEPGSKNRRHRRLDFSLLKSVPLRSLVMDGGLVRSVRVVVKRISPVLHLQGKDWAIGPRILCADQMYTYFEMRSRLQEQSGECGDGPDCNAEPESDARMPIPFVKLEVECGHIKYDEFEAPDCAFLTVWRPGDDLLSGMVREGDEYFVSSLSVGWKIDGDRSRGSGAFLRLSSTKGTSFEKIERQSPIDEHSSHRVCVNILAASEQYKLDEESGRICRERRPAIDVCVYVLSVSTKEECTPSRPQPPPTVDKQDSTRSGTSNSRVSADFKATMFMQHVFVTDGSHRLLCLRVPSSEVAVGCSRNRNGVSSKSKSRGSSMSDTFVFRRGGTSTWREGSVICLRGLEISHYDERLGLLDCLVAEGTQVVTFPSAKSHFSGTFTALQRAAKEEGGEFVAEASKLKRYVDRRILGMDVAPSQDSIAHHDEEADRLTQDLLSQIESPFEAEVSTNVPRGVTVAQGSLATASEAREVWKVRVARVLPVPVRSGDACEANMVALLVVLRGDLGQNIHENVSAFRSVYASETQLCELKELLLLKGESVASEPRGIGLSASDSRSSRGLTQDVARLVRQREADQPGGIEFRFEVRRVTSDRLLRSWKSWERENASFWIVTSIEGTHSADTMLTYPPCTSEMSASEL